ncbi:hypothetical protein [Streptomyces pseudogriseolus]|uniref:hypothetical protein n=1 Tax=Streptomyces pseudogriseolus TaxID=36817 RepID=UPI003FA2C639
MLHLTVLLWLLPPGTAIAFLAVHQCVTDDEQQAALDRIAAGRHQGHASANSKETTVPPKRLGPEHQDAAMESTRSSPRP